MSPDRLTPRDRYLLAIADDELVTGHRSAHWTGMAPSIEEDLAFATLAQDEINHAEVVYGLVDADTDRLALGRPADAYLHAVLCERPPRDFAYTLARQLLYDLADTVRLEALTDSADPDVAAVAEKLLWEERYHLQHALTWLTRMARATGEPPVRLQAALDQAWPEGLWLFEPVDGEDEVVTAGIAPVGSAELGVRWLDRTVPLLAEHGFTVSPAALPDFAAGGGRRGRHTPDWTDDVWPEMTALHRAHPGATW